MYVETESNILWKKSLKRSKENYGNESVDIKIKNLMGPVYSGLKVILMNWNQSQKNCQQK
jgi:hypothetical protein